MVCGIESRRIDPKIPPWKLARDRDIAIKRASWDFKATYPKRAPQCEKQNLSVFKKYGSAGEIVASNEEPKEDENLKEESSVPCRSDTKLIVDGNEEKISFTQVIIYS